MELESYFRINFALMQFHKYSLTEIENLIPWERDIYLALLQQHIEEEKLKQQQQQNKFDRKFDSLLEFSCCRSAADSSGVRSVDIF